MLCEMPTVIVDRDELFERLGWRCSDEAFDDKCFEFGVELDDIELQPTTGRTVYYIAIAANRTDLLCIEGLARALRCFFSNVPPPVRTENPGTGCLPQHNMLCSLTDVRSGPGCIAPRDDSEGCNKSAWAG